MYRCFECCNVFREDEIDRVREEVGEFWGTPAYEERGVCPVCHSYEYGECETCECCGNFFFPGTDAYKLDGQLYCSDCIESGMDNVLMQLSYRLDDIAVIPFHEKMNATGTKRVTIE